MAITVIKKKTRRRRVVVYDLEWIPGMVSKQKRTDKLDTVRLVGAFDRERGYRRYTSVREFLRGELTSENRGKWFYAHAGGMADVQFILEEICRINADVERSTGRTVFEVEASFSGSSAIIVHVKYSGSKNVFHFVDSFWLIRSSLAEIGKGLGMPKLIDPCKTNAERKHWYATAPMSELIPYNQRDCEILYTAIEQFEEVLLDMGSQLQMTQASCAMQLFRRLYLKKSIATMEQVNERALGSYFASRVEVITRECTDALYYDVNSSFPFAMTHPCPGRLLQADGKLGEPGDLFIADVEVEVPDSYLTSVPYRAGNRVFFPTGKWRTWLTSIDLFLLLEQEGRITKVHEVMHFEPCYDLVDYARDIYKRRAASTGFENQVYKIMLNSLYGKFAESLGGQGLYIDPPRDIVEQLDPNQSEMLPGIWLVDTEKEVPHRHVPISSHITAFARQTLFDLMGGCSDNYYCDTDGFCTTDQLHTGKELGEIKLEKYVKRGRFVQPKLYAMSGTDDKGKPLGVKFDDDGNRLSPVDPKGDGDYMVKSKGFSRLEYSQFCALIEGEAIGFERMSRIRDLYRRKQITPEEVYLEKRVKLENIPKRFTYPDGHTRPWTIDELETGNVLPADMRY